MVALRTKIARKLKRFFIDRILTEYIKTVVYNERIPQYSEYSFSQEGEDLILSSICEELEIVKYQEKGYYIDIGAHHPMRFSNTYHFYLKGWNGINIDAMPGSMNLFKILRERDINLEIPISETETEMDFYSFKEPAYNTLDSKIAKQRIAENETLEKVYKLRTRTLESVLDEYLKEDTEIAFMTIDVEGFDMQVMNSNNWVRYRPKIIVVEDENFNFIDTTNSKIYKFLDQKGYVLIAKTRRNLFFLMND